MKDYTAVVAAVIAFAVTAALGFVVIPYLRKLKFGQTILEIGPNWHKDKQGTPTMGGVMIVAGVLFFISFVLINNTLRLLIYSDRFLINTMKLVGATRSFIRRPYLRKGVMIGIIAALLAIGYLALFGYLMRDQLRLFVDYSDYSIYYVVAGAIIVSGIVISWLSTYFAVNKFLSREEKELYYI